MKNLIALALGLLFALLLAEGVLRLLPVNEVMGSMPVNAENPALRFVPNQDAIWSRAGNLCIVNKIHINNYGFVNDQDYVPASDSDKSLPLVAVVGDSYVEALMVPYAETLQGRLAETLHDQARVYSFARSGAPLSQYLAYASYARDHFRPEKLIVVVIANDFNESLMQYKSDAGFHYYREEDGKLVLTRVDYTPGVISRLARHSSLARYLLTNVRVFDLLKNVDYLLNPDKYNNNTIAHASEEMTEKSLLALSAFLNDLPGAAGLPPEDICLVLDGYRIPLYTNSYAPQDDYFGVMRKAMLRAAPDMGYKVVDMNPIFERDYAEHHEIFEYDCDGHWNGRTHGLAARAVLESGFLDHLEQQK